MSIDKENSKTYKEIDAINYIMNTDNITNPEEDGSDVIAGPYHPAFGQHHSAVPRRDSGTGQPPGAAPAKGAVLPALYPAIPQAAAD